MPKKTDQYSISERWTKELLDWGFTPVVNVLIDNYTNLGINSQELILIVHLMRFKWDRNHPFPSYATLAAKMGLHPRRVKQVAKDLETKGFIERIERRALQRSQTNLFDLTPLFEQLETIVRDHRRMNQDAR